MVRLSKLADYAIVLMVQMAKQEPAGLWNARQLADLAHLPLPTVSKILKRLCKAALLHADRGVKGGYRLAIAPGQISILAIIAAMEDPVALTECSGAMGQFCHLEKRCPITFHWQRISQLIRAVLEQLTLAQMLGPATQTIADLPQSITRLSKPIARQLEG